MKQSEICRQLIMLAYDPEPNPDHITISIGDAMDLYAGLVLSESIPVATLEATCEELLDPPTDSPEISSGGGAMNSPSGAEAIIGRGAAEKREIYRKLLGYRSRHGLGCLKKISAGARGVSEDEIRMMLDGAKFDLAKWKKVGAAIDKLEAKENEQKASQRGAGDDADPSGNHDPVPVLDKE